MKKYKIITMAICLSIIGQNFIIDNQKRIYAQEVTGEQNIADLNISKESNGIKITLKEATFDGKLINISYEVKTDKDLGERISVGGIDGGAKIKNYTGGGNASAGSSTKKIGENTYAGKYYRSFESNTELDNVEVEYHIAEISYTENEKNAVIKGDWNFPAINLKSVGRKEYDINKTVEKENAKINFRGIEKSPLQFSLIYIQDILNTEYAFPDWNFSLDFEAKDDLGNIYKSTGNSGCLMESENEFVYEVDFEGLDKNTTKFTVSPKACAWHELGGSILNEKGESVPNVERKYIIFDDIEIDLQELSN